MTSSKKLYKREILLSSGDFTTEVVISDGKIEVYESSPDGLTIGIKEKPKHNDKWDSLNEIDLGNDNLSQQLFDSKISTKFATEISTAVSLAYLRYLSESNGFSHQTLYQYIAKSYRRTSRAPRIICNVLNGGKHTGTGLSFCEFMIIPKAESMFESASIASQVYLDLVTLVKHKLGARHCLVGREGGLAPDIVDVEFALLLLQEAINARNKGKVEIGIDVAANNISKKVSNGYVYKVNGSRLTTQNLVDYYDSLVKTFPEIVYLEDAFHENDVQGWNELMGRLGDRLMVVADDLTVSRHKYLKKFRACYNSCILKINQVGDLTSLMKAYDYCSTNNIKTIISQRSGETDSNILSHLAVGLGCDYIKAGAPARERIVKYNELIRLCK